MTEVEQPRLLFVYGTLKRGFGNHHLLAHSAFVGECRTAGHYRLVVFAGYPALVGDGDVAIHGELYSVDARTLENLDVFEGNAYLRAAVSLADGRQAEGYLLVSALLDRAVPAPQNRWL